jgi:hypothetical protein
MCGKKKKLIEELETEVKKLIANSGPSEDNIHTDYNDYLTLKKRIGNPNSRHYDDDIRWMKDLHNVYLLGMSIRNRQKRSLPPARLPLPPPPPPLPLPHPMLQISPYLHMPPLLHLL